MARSAVLLDLPICRRISRRSQAKLMSRLQRLVCVTILASPLWAQEARRLALVIGISAYNDQIGQLSKPLDDAQSIRTALEQDGFAVTPLLDATRIELLQGLM